VTDERESLTLPEAILSFKTIHVLNDVLKSGKLKATHYCTPLVAGRNPMWAVWTIRGKFLRYSSSRDQIKEAYPDKAWTKTMAAWALGSVDSRFTDIAKRVAAIEEHFGQESGR